MGASKAGLLVKVAYFDESSALDYIDIEYKGRKTKSKSSEAGTKAGLSAEINATTPKLLGFFKAEAKAAASADAQRIVKNQVANTILTDFLHVVERKKRFLFFEGYRLSIPKDSTTSYKTLGPIAKVLKGELPLDLEKQAMSMDISQIGAVVEDVQGYSEFIAAKGDKKYIFRFNDQAFRNNYRLLDVPKMSMSFFGVKVGEIREKDLTFGALYGQRDETKDLQGMVEQDSQSEEEKPLEVYDILLAGIFNDDKK